MLKTKRLSFPLLLLALIAGCTQSQPVHTSSPAAPTAPAAVTVAAEARTPVSAEAPAALLRTTESGFLGDYSSLQTNPLHATSRIERTDKLVQYKSFIVDLPKVLATTTVRGKPVDAAGAAQLASDLKAAVSESLGVNFKLTDKPGQGVARLRAAITQVAESHHELDSPNHKIGGASVEMEIVDSVTGERLAAASESDAVTSRDPLLKSTDPYYDARLVFQHWSARLAKWLSDAQE